MEIFLVKNIEQGIERAKDELYKWIDNKTVLFLSGGQTPKPLYTMLAKEAIIRPAALAMVDERYGKPMHEESNEKMIADSGLLSYAARSNIPFHSILQPKLRLEEAAYAYDETVRKLFFHVPKSVGILGIGSDGHTAGIAPNRKDFKDPIFAVSQKNLFVSSFNDAVGPFGERITLTFEGLSLMDCLIVFVFGKEKKKALKKVFMSGSIEETPARFYNSQEIAKKTLFITDQKI